MLSRWSFAATAEEVADAMSAVESPVLWWPAAFLRAEVLEEGGLHGAGAVVRFLSKGWMPHTFQFVLRIREVDVPWRFVAEARGDFTGWMRCDITNDGPGTIVDCEWHVSVAQPFVRSFSPLVRRAFVRNHRWVMRRGEEGLRLEIERRRSGGLAASMDYPRPTFPHNLGWWNDRIAWKGWTESWERAAMRR
ncbi:MAG: hypothetical protein KDN05_01585 [Verrucomicrobiae bacterium]|nr:hypothetical protein [Verrucomicrobiae bacterium]